MIVSVRKVLHDGTCLGRCSVMVSVRKVLHNGTCQEGLA